MAKCTLDHPAPPCQYWLDMSSNEKTGGGRRRYELKARARARDETRRRITEAALALHETVGPARTTVADVARRAGVGRMTVYNHFPTDADLIAACSGHWAARHPLPDARAWAAIEDPDERLARALGELYAWYREGADMMGNVLRDAPLVPALSAVLDARWWPAVDAMVETLAAGRDVPPEAAGRVRAALRVALDLGTWRALTRAGMADAEAAELGARLVAAAAAPLSGAAAPAAGSSAPSGSARS